MKIRFLPLILLCLLLGGCSRAVAGEHLISAAEGSKEYCTVLNTFLPGYIPREPEDTLYAEVSRGNAVACFDVQAVPAMRRGVGRYWYPHVLGTVVGALVMQLVTIMVNMNNIPYAYSLVIKACIIIAALYLQRKRA